MSKPPTQNQFAYRSVYRRNLPHIQPLKTSLFVTFRLAGSLPASVLARMAEQRRQMERALVSAEKSARLRGLSRRHFAMLEACLDRPKCGPTWLSDARIAQIVSEALHHRDGSDYRLDCYSKMPNHVHMVFAAADVGDTPKSLSSIMHSLKRHTARHANLVLHRAGAFWEHESFDHYIRNQTERRRIIKYVLENPVKAGLVADWRDWPWTYLREEDAN